MGLPWLRRPRAGKWELYRDRSLLLVAAIACLGLLAEGEMEHWSGIYLRDTLGLAAIVGGSGVAVFYGAQALGRLGIGWIVGRVGNRPTMLGSGLLVAGGMALSLATTSPAFVVGGFLLVGVGARGSRASGLLGGRGSRAGAGGVGGLGRDNLRLRGLPARPTARGGPR